MKLECCRICQNRDLKGILDLGEMALANAFLVKDQLVEDENVYPLNVVWCENCGLLQIDEIVPPQILFKDYVYVSGTSPALREHFNGLATTVVNDFGLGNESIVADIGSNDGTLLKEFKELGVKVVGIEPASNIAKIAEESGIRTVNEFFSGETAENILEEFGRFDAITATNVVAHTNDLNDLLKGVKLLLKDDGVFVIEVPYLMDLLEKTEFDTIYHEHLSYIAVRPLKMLCETQDCKIVNIERVKIHGGSIRIFICYEASSHMVNENVENLIALEIDKGLDKLGTYEKFGAKVEGLKKDLVDLLLKLRNEDHIIVGYGAAAKGNTLLNYYNIGPDLVSFIGDLNPMKQNKFTPGTHIPVVDPEKIYESEADHMLILAWNFAEEIMKQQTRFKEKGGRFILPIPEVTIK